MSNSNKGKKPTKVDREILRFLQDGGSINYMTAFQKFKTSGLRDSIYRLRQDGNIILGTTIYYKEGSNKHYENYSMLPQNVIPAGQKVDKILKGDTVSDISKKMQNTINKQIQTQLF